MTKWLTAFFLLAVITGSAASGMPLHAGEKECVMAGMMDCCAKARMKADQPEVSAARLCCALNCTEPGTTIPGGSYQASPQLVIALHGALVPPPASLSGQAPPRAYSPPGLTRHSHPAYIRHLALLI